MTDPDDHRLSNPDARVMRELLLVMFSDMHDIRGAVNHARRSCERGIQLERRAGRVNQETPMLDLLAVIECATTRAIELVGLGLDEGILLMREYGAEILAADLAPPPDRG